ncbi:MAG: ABC transporter permease subunit, partial [Candidatus Methylomirabilales bacterium]
MIQLFQAIASGILMGTLYALIASGFALILGAARVFNLAHGDLVILGAYVGYGLWTAYRLHPLLASPLAVLLLVPLAVSLRPLLAKLKGSFELKALVLCFGLSLFLQNVMQALFTSNYRLIMVPA